MTGGEWLSIGSLAVTLAGAIRIWLHRKDERPLATLLLGLALLTASRWVPLLVWLGIGVLLGGLTVLWQSRRAGPLAVLLVLFGGWGCTTIDQTEHCIGTRYGRVIEEKADPGIASEIGKDYTCFPLTDQNFPEGDDAKAVERMDAQTSDPVTLGIDVSMVYAYDPATIYQQFLEKRSQASVQQEVLNSLRSGARDAVSGWSVAEVFSDQRAFLSDSIKVHVQRKLGHRARLKQVYVRGIRAPESIEKARVRAAEQAQILDQARKQSQIDSVKAATTLFGARAENEAAKLRAQVFENNPKLLDLEIARANAGLCAQAEVCILGTDPPFTTLQRK